jgi:Na+/H+-dicarboxylate symporter
MKEMLIRLAPSVVVLIIAACVAAWGTDKQLQSFLGFVALMAYLDALENRQRIKRLEEGDDR